MRIAAVALVVSLLAAAPAAASPNDIVVGSATRSSHVRAFSGPALTQTAGFLGYDASYDGGVSLAAGRFAGQSVIVVGTRPGAGANVKVFGADSGDLVGSFFAYDPLYTGGVSVAVGNNRIYTGTLTGSGIVNAFDTSFGLVGSTLVSNFGGAVVAAGKVAGEDVVAVGRGAGALPTISLLDGDNLQATASFYGFSPQFAGGTSVAIGKFGSTDAIFVGSGPGGNGAVRIFDASNLTLLTSFFAFDFGYAGGVSVAVTRFDGVDSLIVGSSDRSSTVKVFDVSQGALDQTTAFLAFDPSYDGGVAVAGFPGARQEQEVGGVPEPGVWAQMLAGFGLLGMMRRRRRRTAGDIPGSRSSARSGADAL